MRRATRPTACLGIACAALVGCAGEAAPAPSTLVDGSHARPPPVVLEGMDGPAVATRVTLVRDTRGVRPEMVSCVGAALGSTDIAVVRVGVSGSSVTFLDRRRSAARACDATGRASDSTAWCGHAFARVRAGQLDDPRLSLTCRDASGEPVGFAWVRPLPSASYVAVAQPGYAEVYQVAGATPIRVTSNDVDIANSRARFSITEHTRDGTRLRSYALDARVAG